MAQLFANNVSMELASDLAASDTALTVKSGQGSQCPAIAATDANFMLLTLTDKNGNKEIVKVIEHISGSDVFTIGSSEAVPHSAAVGGRAYEATYDGYQTALAITASDVHTIRMPLTAQTVKDACEFSDVTASVAEINGALDGNTSTAAELSTLHSSGVTNADLVKLHAITLAAAAINVLTDVPLGYLQRAKFTYVDANTITIGPGAYQHAGTTNQKVYWDSDLTFDSTDTGSQWYYLYIDDSAIVSAGTNELTASEFINSTTAPTWSDAKRGWYSGNDRCIFAYYVASGSIAGFYHDGGDYVSYASLIIDRAFADITGNEAVELTIPSFSTKSYVRFNVSLCAAYDFYCGPEAAGMAVVHSALATDSFMLMVMTSASQTISIGLSSYTNANEVGVKTHGWFFPMGV